MHLLQERDGGDGGEEGGVRESGLCRDWSQAASPLPLYVPPAPEEGGETRYYSFNYLHLFKLNKENINNNYGATVTKNRYSSLKISCNHYSYCFRYIDAGSGVLLLASKLHYNLYKI